MKNARKTKSVERWGLLTAWDYDGFRPVLWHQTKPLLFDTRREAREWAEEKYGYVKTRADLRSAPHNWRMPEPIRVDVFVVPKGGRRARR